MPFWDDLEKLLNRKSVQMGSQVGLGALTSYLNNRGQNQQNQKLDQRTQMLDQMAKDEQSRREYYTSILMPSIMRGMGQRNPAAMAQTKSRMPGGANQVTPPWQNYQAPQVAPAQPSTQPQSMFSDDYSDDNYNFMGKPRNPYLP